MLICKCTLRSVEVDYADGKSLGATGWAQMLESMADGEHRPIMIRTLRRLRGAGITVAALTNNFDTDPLPDPAAQAQADREHGTFHN